MKPLLAVLFVSLAATSDATAADLKPLMAVPEEVILENDFSKVEPLKKNEWLKRQGTRWGIEDGVLRGRPSTPEYQAAKPDHKGLETRTSVPATPAEFVAKFRFRFVEGEESAIVPFIEFGHHVYRIR